MFKRHYTLVALAFLASLISNSQTIEPIRYGDMEQWVTRNIKESKIIGGKTRQVYAIGPNAVIDGDEPYKGSGNSPWATSNVMAKVSGITKTSNAVFPEVRPGGGRCARLTSRMETCKALGIININVMVAGSMFLGKMIEPIRSTSDPYSKMEMGVPFTKRPTALVYDYELTIPPTDERIYSSGFSRQRTLRGHDNAEVIVYLQRRWEDAEGNIYAKRVGTAREVLSHSTDGWQNGHRLHIRYGDITAKPGYRSSLGLIPEAKSYYARNSKGKMVPVHEVDWDSADAAPTHIIVMFSAGSGEPYVGTPGLTFLVDNVCLEY